jgi:hypothetical protein
MRSLRRGLKLPGYDNPTWLKPAKFQEPVSFFWIFFSALCSRFFFVLSTF